MLGSLRELWLDLEILGFGSGSGEETEGEKREMREMMKRGKGGVKASL